MGSVFLANVYRVHFHLYSSTAPNNPGAIKKSLSNLEAYPFQGRFHARSYRKDSFCCFHVLSPRFKRPRRLPSLANARDLVLSCAVLAHRPARCTESFNFAIRRRGEGESLAECDGTKAQRLVWD